MSVTITSYNSQPMMPAAARKVEIEGSQQNKGASNVPLLQSGTPQAASSQQNKESRQPRPSALQGITPLEIAVNLGYLKLPGGFRR